MRVGIGVHMCARVPVCMLTVPVHWEPEVMSRIFTGSAQRNWDPPSPSVQGIPSPWRMLCAEVQGQALSDLVWSHVYAATSRGVAFLGTRTVSIREWALGSPMLMKSDWYWHVIPNPKSLQNPVSFFMTCRESAITGQREMEWTWGQGEPLTQSPPGGGVDDQAQQHPPLSSTGPVTYGTSHWGVSRCRLPHTHTYTQRPVGKAGLGQHHGKAICVSSPTLGWGRLKEGERRTWNSAILAQGANRTPQGMKRKPESAVLAQDEDVVRPGPGDTLCPLIHGLL